MDGLLFDPIEYTDPGIRAVMEGNTCRHCANRRSIRQGHDGLNRVQICKARISGRTKSGYLRVRCDQPACILFTRKDNKK